MSAKSVINPPKSGFPLAVKRGNVTVKIYRTQSAGGYVFFQVADYSTGQRRLRSFSDLAEARCEAERIASAIASGEAAVLDLSAQDRSAYVRSLELLKSTGTPVEVASATYAEAFKVLGGDHLMEAARWFAKRNPAKLPVKTVAEVVTEFLDAKRTAKASDRYMQDLRYRLGKLSEAFQCNIGSVTGDQLQSWFDAAEFSPQSRKNFRTVLHGFFGFAMRRGYLPRGWDELDRLEKVKLKRSGNVDVFTPDEVRKLLGAALPDFLPALAIGAFAGLRTAEIERIDWREVHLAERFIEVTAGNAKTASRRIVPITDNLAMWLAPYANRTGLVWLGGKTVICDVQSDTAEAAGVKWKKNGLRHSFISYRLALVKNAAQVALEAGNSAHVIFAHYRELVREKDAQAWFAITPDAPANVLSIATAEGRA